MTTAILIKNTHSSVIQINGNTYLAVCKGQAVFTTDRQFAYDYILKGTKRNAPQIKDNQIVTLNISLN